MKIQLLMLLFTIKRFRVILVQLYRVLYKLLYNNNYHILIFSW